MGCSTGSGAPTLNLDEIQNGSVPATRTVRIIGCTAVQEAGPTIKLDEIQNGSVPATRTARNIAGAAVQERSPPGIKLAADPKGPLRERCGPD
jgi:hypothetical protein